MKRFRDKLVVAALLFDRYLCAPDTIRIGGLFPLFLTEHYSYSTFSGGALRASAFLKAIEDLNDKTDGRFDNLLPDCLLSYDIGDSRLDKASAFISAQNLFTSSDGPHAIVGPDTEGEATFATAAVPNTPFVSYSSSSSRIVLDDQFANFIRFDHKKSSLMHYSIVPSTADYSQAIVSLLQSNDWKRVGILSSSDPDSMNFKNDFITVALSGGITIVDTIEFEQEDDLDSIKESLKSFRDFTVRIIILMTSSVEAPTAIAALYHAGLTGIDGAQVIASPSVMMTSSLMRLAIDYDFTQQEVEEAMRGMLGFIPIGSTSTDIQTFLDDLVIDPPAGNYSCEALGNYGPYLSADVEVYSIFDHDNDNNASTRDLCAFVDFSQDVATSPEFFDPFASYAYDAVIVLAAVFDSMRNNYLNNCDVGDDDCLSASSCLTDDWYNAQEVTAQSKSVLDNQPTFGITGRITLNQNMGRNVMNTELVLLNFLSSSIDTNWAMLEDKYVTGITSPYSLYPAGDLSVAFQKVASFVFPSDVYTSGDEAYFASSSKKALIWDGTTVEYSTTDGKPISDGSLKDQSQVPLAMTIALYLTSIILLLEAIGLSIYTHVMRANRLIRLSQPPLLQVVLLAGAFVSISCFLAAETVRNDATCIARAWCFHLGIIIMLSGLAIKTYRVHIIVNNKKFKRIKFGDKKVVRILVGITVAAIIYLSLWTVMDPPTKSRGIISSDQSSVNDQQQQQQAFYDGTSRSLEHGCVDDDDCVGYDSAAAKETVQVIYYCKPGDSTLHSILRAGEVIALAVTGYFSWLTRDVPAVFNESRYIAASIQLTVCTFLVAFPTSIFLRDRERYLESSFTDWMSVSLVLIAVISLIFLPKVYGVHNDVDIQESYKSNNMKAMSTMGAKGIVLGILCCCCGSLGVCCDVGKDKGNEETKKNDANSPTNHGSQMGLMHAGRSESTVTRILSADKPAFNLDEVRDMESRMEGNEASAEASRRGSAPHTSATEINNPTLDSVDVSNLRVSRLPNASSDEVNEKSIGSEARREVVKLALSPQVNSSDSMDDDNERVRRRRQIMRSNSNVTGGTSDRDMTGSEIDDLDIEDTMPIPVQINQYELVKLAIMRKVEALAGQQEELNRIDEERRHRKANPPELPPRKSSVGIRAIEMQDNPEIAAEGTAGAKAGSSKAETARDIVGRLRNSKRFSG